MIVYYFVFLITLLFAYFIPAKTDKQWRWKLFWTFLPLFLFGALRVNFGNDYVNYEGYFYEFHRKTFIFDPDSHAEYGYQLLNYLMPSFRSVLLLNSFLLYLALAVFCHRNIPREYLWLAVLLIFLNVEKNIYGTLVGVRNGFAVTTFLLGSVFIQKRKILAFTGITVLAMSLHSSALFYMPVAYVVGHNTIITKKEILVWIIAAIAILMTSLSSMMYFLEQYLVDDYESYTRYLEGEGHRGWLLTITGLTLFFVTLYLFWGNRQSLNSNQNSLVRLGIMYIITTLFGSLAFRAGYFYDMFFIGTVVTLFTFAKRSNDVMRKALVIISILMSVYSFFLWRTATVGNVKYDEYHSILESIF